MSETPLAYKLSTNATSTLHWLPLVPQSITCDHGNTGGQMTVPLLQVGRAFSCFSHCGLGLAVYRWPRCPPSPPPYCGADRLKVHRADIYCFVNRSRACAEGGASLIHELAAIVRSQAPRRCCSPQTACRPVDQLLLRSWLSSTLHRSVRH
jgi:hypothetical protein